MKWVVVAILVLVVPYTILTLRYRKAGPAFAPYDDLKDRANVSRLLDAGYQRISLVAERLGAEGARTPADAAGANAASVSRREGGLPADLRATLVEPPLLAAEILGVAAAPMANSSASASANTNTSRPYIIRFTCTLPDEKHRIAGAELYIRGDAVMILPSFEHGADDSSEQASVRARSRESAATLSVPTGALRPGRYAVTLVGERVSYSWPLEVK